MSHAHEGLQSDIGLETGIGLPPMATERPVAAGAAPKASESEWSKHLDKETGDYYYFNAKTGQVTWDDPNQPDHVVSPRSKSNNRKKNFEVAQRDRRGTIMPPGWTSAVSSSTGKKYYVRPDGGGTQWEKPPGNEAGSRI